MANVLYEIKDEIAFVTINRPKALNALNEDVIKELNVIVDDISARKDIKVMILTGAGDKSFVAGADITAMQFMSVPQARAFSLFAQKVFSKIERMPQVAIAAVNGFALGGGCEIAMCCDIRYAADTASFGQPETGLGIIPGFAGTQRLPRLVGKAIAKEMIFSCDIIKADEAHRIGLVNKVVPAAELMEFAVKRAKTIMSKSSFANSIAKAVINEGMDVDAETSYKIEADGFGICFASPDQREGMTAFVEKRKPNLTDF